MRQPDILPPLILGAALFLAGGCKPAADPPLRFLSGAGSPVSVYDPVRAFLIPDFIFLENVYSPLLEYSAEDKLVSGLAASYRWEGNEAVFRMRPGQATASGRAIDAYDAEFSLKRAFVLGGPDYDLLRELLCGGALKKISDPCPNLRVTEGGRALNMRFDEKKTFLFHLLANIAYAVVPRNSVNSETLAITDYADTSGPYYVESDDGAGSWTLRANPRHYRYSPGMPQAVRAVPFSGFLPNDKAMEMLKDGKIDYMTSGLVRTPDDKTAFVAANEGYAINITQPVRMVYAVFTDRGMKRLTREERFYAAARMREIYLKDRPMCEAPLQFFRLEGALDKAQMDRLAENYRAGSLSRLEKPVTGRTVKKFFWRPGDGFEQWLPRFTEVGFGVPIDFSVNSGDIGFQDDVGLVLNYFKLDFFEMSEAEKAGWLKSYLAADGKKARVAMLRDLHFRTLLSGRVIPIAVMPYASVARKQWAFDFQVMCGGDQFWRLRKR